MTTAYTAYLPSPVGLLLIQSSETAITKVLFTEEETVAPTEQPEVLEECLHQLSAFFDGKLQDFSVALEPAGTPFQQQVWKQLVKIPYADTISYLDLSKQLGDEKVIRAAASANGANPIAIIIPCHRVIGSNGSLTGYAGGLHRKQWLLEFEGKTSGKKLSLF